MEKPILFNAEMVNAVLDGRKSMTRRIVKPQPVNPKWSGSQWIDIGCDDTKHFTLKCYYKKGMNLWVREAFITGTHIGHAPWVRYRATDEADIPEGAKWKPSIFMPRWASRINLEITDVRIEKLQDITEANAIAEGIGKRIGSSAMGHTFTAVEHFHVLWDSINKKKGYGWGINPWCWAISFEVW